MALKKEVSKSDLLIKNNTFYFFRLTKFQDLSISVKSLC